VQVPLKYPLLVVDAGNTAVKFATVAQPGARPKMLRAVPTAKLGAAAARRFARTRAPIEAASVVPSASRILKSAFPHAQFIGPRTTLSFDTKVDRKTIGADRLANVAAVHARHGGKVVVASFGTAATFDTLDASGAHLGGAIAPGWKSFASSPSSSAAQLPRVDARIPSRAIGRNTREALQEGINAGYAALVSTLIARMKKEARTPGARVVFTGGDASVVAKLTRIKAVTDPLLTVKGIAVIAEAAAREGRK